ncbi:ribbon-helix-helix domain-containing protein [Hoeflea alexandrii]|uniref:Siderophore biosynthesis-like protein n=1 Tax=Hoeflea alexandrii TaxID=288436 RepID=A0ABT1CUD8_9HYPH|nr:ribbon-helix-helix domain-containing protein [Hoeflea alexandrii]MCO6409807.1 siderophore biosynthesis-like protein [Hoeflea alexandrii]MCY0152813.1 ribbon-helix-helix domain-containing protein [Hoeflea alexandrii]
MAEGRMRKHSVSIRGHRTSITLEDAFMDALRQMADERNIAVAALIAEIDSAQVTPVNLSSAIRLAVLDWALKRRDETISHD